MNQNQLEKLGICSEAARTAAMACIKNAARCGYSNAQIRKALKRVATAPQAHLRDPLYAALAQALIPHHTQGKPTERPVSSHMRAPYCSWGTDLDPKSIEQMEKACSLPISVRGALMPDAHVGYGLPIGGVLATDNAVIPYAVGVDIACRMKLSVLDVPPQMLEDERCAQLQRAIETQTKFGIGASFHPRRSHPVMDEDWNVSPITRQLKDKAWGQLGTSGSGNHFVEFGLFHIEIPDLGLEPGVYLALLTHSGSRGTGAEVCTYYSKRAKASCKGLPSDLQHLAWLPLDSADGQEYWAAMELMGKYAAANHALIHQHIVKFLGAQVVADVENHHNFGWREKHDGRLVVVHRKGATPAAKGQLGIIPGSMASPAYIVRGKGNPDSLQSVSHGAGRVISRTQAKKQFSWRDVQELLQRKKVKVLTAGLDEIPLVYKDIDAVMACQTDLAEVIAHFEPRLVKMAPAGERPED